MRRVTDEYASEVAGSRLASGAEGQHNSGAEKRNDADARY
jgi:hypothetical protein